MESQSLARDETRPFLMSIPLEVLHQITSNLTTPEYGNLRCTCKQIEGSLFNSFSREFFTKRQFMFTEFSLQTLVEISKSRLSPHLSHIIFGLERPSLAVFPSISQTITIHDLNVRYKINALLHEYLDHIGLITTGQDVEMLIEAFSNLKNLETIGIRDFNSRSRIRDHPDTEWKSYGVATFELHTGTGLDASGRTFPDRANYLSRTFLNILRALGKAGSRPKHFEVILRSSSLHDHAFYLPKYVEPLVQPVLANFRTIYLDLSSGFPLAQVEVGNLPIRCPSYLLRRFLSRVPQLEHLRLNFQFYKTEEAIDVLSWFSKPMAVVASDTIYGRSFVESPPPIDFSNLQRLDLGMITIEPQILLAIIKKYRHTLHTISFHKVSLLQANSAESRDKVNLWATFFGQLSKFGLNLSAMNLSFISQEQAGKRQHFRPIMFKDSRNPRSKQWAGTDMQSGLRDFADYMMIEWPDNDTESTQTDESSDSSDQDLIDMQSNSEDDNEALADEMDI